MGLGLPVDLKGCCVALVLSMSLGLPMDLEG
jgi:hypothetical protein